MMIRFIGYCESSIVFIFALTHSPIALVSDPLSNGAQLIH